MRILAFSGSDRPASSNAQLLQELKELRPDITIVISQLPGQLPLFRAQLDGPPVPEIVKAWREELTEADGLIIATPEYAHNLPALVKNALEWVVSSGELVGKPVLPITFTPQAPRGEKAMQSLVWTLVALDMRVLAQLPLYKNQWTTSTGKEMAMAALELF